MKHTWSSAWRRLATTNVTLASFTEPAAYLSAAPANGAGRAVIDLMDDSLGWTTDKVHVPDLVEVMFFGAHVNGAPVANNKRLNVYVRGYRQLTDSSATYNGIWLKSNIGKFVATLCDRALPGSSAGVVQENIADTIVLSLGNASLNLALSQANEIPASVLIDTTGLRYLEFWFEDGGDTLTNGNAFIRGVSEE